MVGSYFLVLRPNLIRDLGFEPFFRIWDWFESFFQDSNLGFVKDSPNFVEFLRGFVEKLHNMGRKFLNLVIYNARFCWKMQGFVERFAKNLKIEKLIRIPQWSKSQSRRFGDDLNPKNWDLVSTLPLAQFLRCFGLHHCITAR